MKSKKVPAIRYEKPLVCKECKEKFMYPSNLNEHIRKFHKKYKVNNQEDFLDALKGEDGRKD